MVNRGTITLLTHGIADERYIGGQIYVILFIYRKRLVFFLKLTSLQNIAQMVLTEPLCLGFHAN